MSSQVFGTLTWLLKPQNEVVYKKLIAFLHYRKTAPKWPLYKKLVHPTWFIHTTICLQWLGNQPHFFSIKQLVVSALYGTQAPSKRRGNLNGDQHGDCWASTKCLPNAGAVSSLQKSIMNFHDLMNPKIVSLQKFTGILTCPKKSQQHAPTKVNWCYLLVCKMVYLQKLGVWGTFSLQNRAPTAFCIGLKASMFVVEIGTGIYIYI